MQIRVYIFAAATDALRIMKIRLFLYTLIASATLNAGEPPKGFTALFNGKNLDGWQAKPNGWAVEKGVLTRKPRSGYIWTEKSYGDFILDVEVKVSSRCNSGIFFRTNPKNAVQGGFEIQRREENRYPYIVAPDTEEPTQVHPQRSVSRRGTPMLGQFPGRFVGS